MNHGMKRPSNMCCGAEEVQRWESGENEQFECEIRCLQDSGERWCCGWKKLIPKM